MEDVASWNGRWLAAGVDGLYRAVNAIESAARPLDFFAFQTLATTVMRERFFDCGDGSRRELDDKCEVPVPQDGRAVSLNGASGFDPRAQFY